MAPSVIFTTCFILLLVAQWSMGQTLVPPGASCPTAPPGCDTFCPYGFQYTIQGQCSCRCYDDPCQSKLCRPSEVCIVQQSSQQYWAVCTQSIAMCSRHQPFTRCLTDPCRRHDNCGLPAHRHVVCMPNHCGACRAHFFERWGFRHRDVTVECNRMNRIRGGGQAARSSESRPGTCPDMTAFAGLCTQECLVDSDCLGERKCCSTGPSCGWICAGAAGLPLSPPTDPAFNVNIVPQLPGQNPLDFSRDDGVNESGVGTVGAGQSLFGPAGQGDTRQRQSQQLPTNPSTSVGECPVETSVPNRRCIAECTSNDQCGKFQLCCSNACAQVCTYPQETSDCIQMVAAIARLSIGTLANGYLPACHIRTGQYEQRQCDETDCWCVHAETGAEIIGTKQGAFAVTRPVCNAPRRCSVRCGNNCAHGYATDTTGCPLSTCECRDPCRHITCANTLHSCQLVQPLCDRGRASCVPVPKCLINPCPRGRPLTLPETGVTALCSGECTVDQWCHRIGFNGLGFCCDKPEVAIRAGECPAVRPNAQADDVLSGCRAQCHVDSECRQGAKCCFDGCGLACVDVAGGLNVDSLPSTFGGASPIRPTNLPPSTKLGSCPSTSGQSALFGTPTSCPSECTDDSQCGDVQKCCRVACGGRKCLYPHSAPVYGLSSTQTPKCNRVTGAFEEVQCRGSTCWCVNVDDGVEVPGTRTIFSTPNCRTPLDCRRPPGGESTCLISTLAGCQLSCPHGYERESATGCARCACRDPCLDAVQCSRTQQICAVRPVVCDDASHCPPQPVCVTNMCPAGVPSTLPTSGQLEQCDSIRPCANQRTHWCNMIGYSFDCCPAASVSNNGVCPTAIPIVIPAPSSTTVNTLFAGQSTSTCRNGCRSDVDCIGTQKCCFDGCSLQCVSTSDAISTLPIRPTNGFPSRSGGPGVCPVDIPTVPGCRVDCQTDDDCRGAGDKCCVTGCSRLCARAELGNGIQDAASLGLAQFGNRIGACPTITAIARQTCTTDIATCSTDADCAAQPFTMCCADGCARSCVTPGHTSACYQLTIALAKMTNIAFRPRCRRSDGGFERVQCDSQQLAACWCVNEDGLETPGTRVRLGTTPNCDAPRQCPSPTCPLTCAYGLTIGRDGCASCKCHNPCELASSPTVMPTPQMTCGQPFERCVMDTVECAVGRQCAPVPKCVVNACPVGSPLVDDRTFALRRCQGDSTVCGPNAFCREFTFGESYCCGGASQAQNAGSCPIIGGGVNGACSVMCNGDGICDGESKCCFNGCGMQCVKPLFLSIGATSTRGECEQAHVRSCPNTANSFIATAVGDTCSGDAGCGEAMKCCTDGCSRSCGWPSVSTACLHKRASFERLDSSNAFVNVNDAHHFSPTCTPQGEFNAIQQNSLYKWCVDGTGFEVPGTRQPLSEARQPPCTQPRPCRRPQCARGCPLGHAIDPRSGCESCSCADLCANVRCAASLSCMVVPVKCYEPACPPIAMCLPSVCPTGVPYADASTGTHVTCSASAAVNACPPGHYCKDVGVGAGIHGFCCPLVNSPGEVTPSTAKPACPSRSITTSTTSKCRSTCQSHTDCSDTQSCCFDGCALACRSAEGATNSPSTTATSPNAIRPIGNAQPGTGEKQGLCPITSMSNPGCVRECEQDGECPGFEKCCQQGCGQNCQLPTRTTACVHMQAALQSVGATHVPECDERGQFRQVQTDGRSGQAWCVNTRTGVEIVGTRQNLGIGSLANVNCAQRRECSVRCSTTCQHGLLLDASGCPTNNVCTCRDVCADVVCRQQDEVCVPERAQCTDGVCPPIPTCKPNSCGARKPAKDSAGRWAVCSGVFANDCAPTNTECVMIPGEATLGLCCTRDPSGSSRIKIGECNAVPPEGLVTAGSTCVKDCENNAQCAGAFLCCSYGCSKTCVPPVRATNCLHYQSSMDAVSKSLAGTTSLAIKNFRPVCDARSGMYNSVQCDTSQGVCYCVDTVTGIEIIGTRGTDQHVDCTQRSQCPVTCYHRERVCRYGFLADATTGCPLDSTCKCRLPCEEITCASGAQCIMKPAKCGQGPNECQLMPTCVPNACYDGRAPATEPTTGNIYMCTQNGTQACPGGFHCGRNLPTEEYGVCCPGQRPAGIANEGSISAACRHADPYTSVATGTLQTCAKSDASCPDNYECRMPDSQLSGICCVTSAHVCAMTADKGPCSSNRPRWRYDSGARACVEFTYGGCRGNLNNFQSQTECARFCANDQEATSTAGSRLDEPETINFEMGFNIIRSSRTVPTIEQQAFLTELRRYIRDGFGAQINDIQDMRIDGRRITFRLSSRNPNIVQIAARIREKIDVNQFFWVYNTVTYQAEGGDSVQVTQLESTSTTAGANAKGNTATVGLFIALGVFVSVLIIALCMAAICLYRRANDETGSFTSTPVQQTYTNGYMAEPILHTDNGVHVRQHAVKTNSSAGDDTSGETASTDPMPHKAFTTDDMDVVKEGGSYYSQAQYVWQNGRRRSAQTMPDIDQKLYY